MRKIITSLCFVLFIACSHDNKTLSEAQCSVQTSDSIYEELLQDKLDSIFDIELYLEDTVRSSFIYDNVNHILTGYIETRFKKENNTDSLPNEKSLEYAKDTFSIQETSRFCQKRDYTTLRMSLCNIYREEAQRYLVNKYYTKLMSILKEEDKLLLKENQEHWYESYKSDKLLSKKITSEKYTGGGTMWQIVDYSDQQSRIQFLFDCYNQNL